MSTEAVRAIRKHDPKAPANCAGKKGYMTRKYAKQTAKQRSTISGERIEHYRCVTCGLYHIGHPPRVLDIDGALGETTGNRTGGTDG